MCRHDAPALDPVIVYGYARAGMEAYSACFTLAAQPRGREIVGRPTVSLWVSTPAPEVDLHVYRQAVHRRGGAEVISSGSLRLSHRRLGASPYRTGGVPWHSHRRGDVQGLPKAQAFAVDIALSATSYALQPGDLLRLRVAARGPRDAAEHPSLRILCGSQHPSWLEVPDVDTRADALDPDVTWGRRGPLEDLVGTVGTGPS